MRNGLRGVVVAWTIGMALASADAQAQVIYYEDFRPELATGGGSAGTEGVDGCYPGAGGAGTYPFPNGWLLRNVDNRTPHSEVGYVNEAWEIREDFGYNVTNCAAFSTSYYSPAGAANDWMWTPLITIPAGEINLSWRAVAYDPDYPDGYEVRVMTAAAGPPTGGTGMIGNQITTSTQVFSTAAENTAWTPRSVNLSAYAGQSVYIGFRNTSNDKFLLLIDDVMVRLAGYNLTAEAPAIPYYSRLPTGATFTPSPAATARNSGDYALTDVVGSTRLTRDDVDATTPVASGTIPTLAISATSPLVFANGPGTISGNGTWRVRYDVAASQSSNEINVADNTSLSLPTVVGGSEFARHAGPRGTGSGALGIGAGNGGEIGVEFQFDQSTQIIGVRFAINGTVPDPKGPPPSPPYIHRALIRAMENDQPGAIVATTGDLDYPYLDAGPRVVDGALQGGPVTLPAGRYVALVTEAPMLTMQLHMHPERYVAGATWIWWPTSPLGPGYAHMEAFGTQYRLMPAVSVLTDLVLFRDGLEDTGGPARVEPEARTPSTRRSDAAATRTQLVPLQ